MEGMQTSWKRGVNGEEFVEALLNEKTKNCCYLLNSSGEW